MSNFPTLEQLREERANLETELNETRAAVEAEGRDYTDDEAAAQTGRIDRMDAIDARVKQEEREKPHLKPTMSQVEAVEVRAAAPARPKNPDSEEKTYRPDNIRERNFWADMVNARSGDYEARERLVRNQDQGREWNEAQGRFENRDMGNASTAGAEFLPPLYLSDLWIHPNMAGRPLADRLPKYPLSATGTEISVPKLSSGISVAGRASGGAVSETDGVTATVAHKVQEYAGLVDIDRIAVMRSDPGLQEVLTRTLVRRYNVALDTDLLSGSGTNSHYGIDNIGTGLNTVTWTQGTPTAAKFLSQIYAAVSAIDTNRVEERPDLVVMHGRREAWAAQPNASTFSLFQQSQLYHSSGTQDGGFVTTVAGLELVSDNNITVTAGATTSQDKCYVLVSSDFLLAEGPLYAKVHEDVGSGTGAIRYAVFAHSAFLSKRYPTGAAVISGTGMIAPAFDS